MELESIELDEEELALKAAEALLETIVEPIWNILARSIDHNEDKEELELERVELAEEELALHSRSMYA
jgi:hypothetical protein